MREHVVDLRGHIVLPGFIDVHVHGLEGVDTLDGGDVDCRDCGAAAEVWRDRLLSDDGGVRPGGAARGAAERRGSFERASSAQALRECCRPISKATSSIRTIAARSRSAACEARWVR